MTTVQQANAISRSIEHCAVNWITMGNVMRATWVIDWCKSNNVNYDLTPAQLATAMSHMPYWSQGPSNYLDFVIAHNASSQA